MGATHRHKLGDMISKTQIINALFLASFACYDFGKYVAKVVNFSVGNMVSVAPILIMIGFYLIDIITSKGFQPKLTSRYLLLASFILSVVALSYARAFSWGHPTFNSTNIVFLVIHIVALSHAALIVWFYNSNDPDFNMARYVYWGLTIDLMVNLVGYAIGLENVIHYIPGRLNLPFSQGLYSMSNSIVIMNLLILGAFLFESPTTGTKVFMGSHFVLNLYLLLGFNSRLSMALFAMLALLTLTKAIRYYRVLYFLSFLTIFLLLRFSELVFYVFQLPGLNSIFRQATFEDVTSFNGRRELWQRGIDWLLSGSEGVLLGHGYQGHYTIGLLDGLSEFWHRSSSLGLHMHSTFYELVLSQGIIGTLPLLLLIFLTLGFLYKNRAQHPGSYALLAVLMFLVFLLQIDIYAYITNTGSYLLYAICASVCVRLSPVRNPNSPKLIHELSQDQYRHAIL